MEAFSLLQLLDSNISGLNETQLLHLYGSFRVFDLNLKEENVALMCLYVPVFLMGFLGNIVVAALVLSFQQLRNSTNLYLCNMAIADFLGNVWSLFQLLFIIY